MRTIGSDGEVATYLITGATRGIGREVVRLLADHTLVLIGRDIKALGELAGSLPAATFVIADFAAPDAIPVDGWPERVDGVVHCAGIAGQFTVADTVPATYERMFTLNVVAVAELTRRLLPALRAAGGTVVVVNSGQGLRVVGDSAAYAASKHALRAYADALRANEPDVRVSSVYPGRVATEMQVALRAQENAPYEPERYLAPTTVARVIVDALMLPADAVLTDVTLTPRHP